MKTKHQGLLAFAGLALFLPTPALAQDCPSSVLSAAKGNGLYLYFPTTADSSFPEYNVSVDTSPLEAFDVADLDSGIGTTAALRDRIFEIVTDDYCEFDVRAVSSTTSPSPTEARWQVLGIGSDDEPYGGGYVFGVAQAVDTGDSDGQDYARVYADSFGGAFGGAGDALNGSDSTLERWATAIGHTAAHEAGHNYGLSHANADPVTGEDVVSNHVLATGSDLTGEIRASRRRHFSDTSYEVLGHNLGLNLKTLHNWDFVNPNDTAAHSVVVTLLSQATTLTINWSYNGTKSPWTSPGIVATGGTEMFQGTSYNVFKLTFETDKSWSGGADGVAPPGVEFHVGAAFAEADAVIVYETRLRDSGGNDLDLHPRMIGYDTGALDLSTGDFSFSLFNARADLGTLLVKELQVSFLPRVVSLEAMVDGARAVDVRGIPVGAGRRPPAFKPVRSAELERSMEVPLARLTDTRSVDILYDDTDCTPGIQVGSGPADVSNGEMIYCPTGNALSLFPATSIYVTATIVEPNARYFDPGVGAFVNGPLESKLYYQFVGVVPDANGNGTDDLIDIRTGLARDDNGNGVPDDSEPGAEPETENETIPEPEPARLPWYWMVLVALLFVVVIAVVMMRRSN